MITNDEELAVAQRQLGIAEEILESWRRKLMPQNPKNFAIYSEGCVDQINILKVDIEEYLTRKSGKLPNRSGTPVVPNPSIVS